MALMLAFGLSADRMIAADTGDRTISLYHIHTKETLSITYKKDGKYVPDALKKIDWLMRDWRKNEAIRIDPATIDLIWEMHTELGSREPAHIICGYRSEGTNNMLRRTRGGQASQSQHMTGKAIDVAFPDVPLKRMRYSALVRERGGVGYYPTSGIPFVHVDTARVRAWPRLPRYELALLFPQGRTRHAPADGGSITPSDVSAARAKHRELATQIAEFHEERRAPRSAIQIALSVPMPSVAKRPQQPAAAATATAATQKPSARNDNLTLAALTPAGSTGRTATDSKRQIAFAPMADDELPWAASVNGASVAATAPKLVGAPKLVERGSKFKPRPTDADRSKLAALVAKAQSAPVPKLVVGPKPAARPAQALAAAAATSEPGLSQAARSDAEGAAKGARVAALTPEPKTNSITDMSPESLGNGWVQAPEFDEDHPEELAYRPFPLAPLLTETASAHDPQLAGLQHPDVAKTLEMIDDEGAIQPMRFRPGQQLAQVMWAQQFQGKAVHLDALLELAGNPAAAPTAIGNRNVKTSAK